MKKLNTKQIIIIVGIVLIIASIAGNLYFGWIKIRENIYQQGLNDGAVNIVNQIKGGIKINFDDGIILFVPAQ